MSQKKASFGTRLGYWIVYGSCYVVGLLPHRFLYYILAELVYFLVYKLGRYRVKVVRQNLSRSFPEKDTRELRGIERRFYHNLSEYFIDTIALASISEKRLKKRMVSLGLDELNDELKGRNWIVMLGHYGSWELRNAYALEPGMSVLVSAYHPLNNRVFDMYCHKIRHRFSKLRSEPSHNLLKYYITHRDGIDGHSVNLALIADQNAPLDAQSQWVRFLNQPTVFFHGGEKIARKFNMPVYYAHLKKVKRGHYIQTFEMIWDGVSPTSNHEITNRFAELLEAEIRECPELWLWSHRRWKKTPKGEDAANYNARYGTDLPV